MASKSSRVQKEQLRKRRNNLLRRHNDFWRLYSIKSWLIMEAPDGRVFTYHSHPDLPAPTPQEMVRHIINSKTCQTDSQVLPTERKRPASCPQNAVGFPR